jgi:hypothetical protein
MGGSVSSVVSELGELVDHLEGVRARAANAFAAETFFFSNVARLVERRERERAGRRTDGVVVDATQLGMREVYAEIAAALQLSEYQVAARVSSASVLMHRFNETLCEVSEGRLSPQHATVIADTGTVIEDAGVRAEYERHALEIASELTPAQLRDALEGLVARLDPDGTRERIREAVARRQVRVRRLEPGLSRLTLDLPTAQGVGAFDRLRTIATELAEQNHAVAAGEGDSCAGGRFGDDADRAADADDVADDRTQSQLMADIAADLLLTSVPEGHGATQESRTVLGAIRPTVQVTIPAAVLTSSGLSAPGDLPASGDVPISGECAVVSGFGPVDDDTARTLAAAADVWRRVFTDPGTGVPVTVDRYRPSVAQRLLIEARDQHCRFPGCRRPAQNCDLDHTVAAADGGPTDVRNLACLCRRHHTVKHHTDWELEQQPGGVLNWTSPTRRFHRTRPPGAVRFIPDPPPGGRSTPPHPPHHPAPF